MKTRLYGHKMLSKKVKNNFQTRFIYVTTIFSNITTISRPLLLTLPLPPPPPPPSPSCQHTTTTATRTSPRKLTLSGLLNFIDGLWSSCGDERIIMFTTNHKERLDLAQLRPGWMDVHIHKSYCSPCKFKTLAANYLGLNDHSLFPEIEGLLGKTMVTPAEIGEQLLKNEDPESVLQGLVEFLIEKKRVAGEKEAKKLDQKEDDVEEIGNKNAEEDGESVDGEMLETHDLDFYIR
ncbi:hypothetical protein ACSBR2_003305 [Camellia fascicularis]